MGLMNAVLRENRNILLVIINVKTKDNNRLIR